jgi:hypothetical protein
MEGVIEIEDEPHITLFDGSLTSRATERNIEKYLNKCPDYTMFKDIYIGQYVTYENVDMFDCEDNIVVKINVLNSPLYDVLNNINKYIRRLPHEVTYPDYNPHITICKMDKDTSIEKILSICKFVEKVAQPLITVGNIKIVEK